MIKINIMANLVGKLYTAGISFLVLPIYLKYLGAESYGLVGIFGMIQAFALLLDSGITPMVTREIARIKGKLNSALHLRNLLRTTEILFIAAGLVAFTLIYFFASFISTKWLNANTLSSEVLTQAIVLIGVIVAFRFNVGFYGGAIMALEKQVSYNVALSIIATIKSLGAIYILMYVSNDIVSFFKFQIFVSLLEFFVYRFMVARYMPTSEKKASFSLNVYKNNLHFIGGYSLSMIFIFILLQSGNIVLSKILSLSEFGYYTFAMAIVSILQMAGGPLFQAISPRLISTYANDRKNLEIFYHKSCQAVAFLLIPAGLMLSVYSYEIILLWTQNQEATNNVYLIVSLLSFGTLLNLLATMPGQLQIADGRTKVMVYINAFSIIFVLPMNIWLGQIYGGVGVALVWISLNILYLLAGILFVHPQLLNENKSKWIWGDIIKPMIFVVIFLGLSKYFYIILSIQEIILNIFYLLIVLMISYLINTYSLDLIKLEVFSLINRQKVKKC
ncbi:oligosaccharide flippase family protein [Aliarcobacter cryaerophilus]|uniref:oligosaccharide flippase family protein n=1 Tax=Aliarcobacter cryaerophilus TaxID=28198 RepID=UPI0021B6958D|nr:oligosaccharide flippase family protein [Aliarcobacter cryaerophilus]MCT7539709.1 oligosaccharide flippase family protein [Aliarcobacter cryaerophilus]